MRRITQLYNDALRPIDLRASQLETLVILRSGGTDSVSALAEEMGTDPTTMSRNLKPLLDRDLVRSEPGVDRRQRVISLTPTALALLAEAVPLWRIAQDQVERDLGSAGVARLIELLAASSAETGPPAA